jgi:hypothetical protein
MNKLYVTDVRTLSEGHVACYVNVILWYVTSQWTEQLFKKLCS